MGLQKTTANSAPVVLITGASSGIGLSLAERLLTSIPRARLCLACRSKTKAEAVIMALKLAHPEADIEILLVDVSSMKAVYRAAKEVKQKYNRVDLLYLNAGVMGQTTVDWKNFWKGVFSKELAHMFHTGEGLLVHEDHPTDEGLQYTFATNVMGHFILIKELEPLLGGDFPSKIVWTGSTNATERAFSLKDVQHKHGSSAYASSKYAVDLLNVALNEKLRKKNICSAVTNPGLVMTNMTHGILPTWFWTLALPLLYILRIIVPNITIDPYNGSEVLLQMANRDPCNIDPYTKYQSSVSVIGQRYVSESRLDLNENDALDLYRILEEMEKTLQNKLTS